MNVRVNLEPMRRLQSQLRVGLGMAHGEAAFDAMFKQWAVRYSAFARRRYRRNAAGGGDWPGLAASTKRKRRGPQPSIARDAAGRYTKTGKGKARSGGRRFSILIDTGRLVGGLSIGAPGNLNQRIAGGVRYGFGGPAQAWRRSAGGQKTAQLTIRRLAEIHQAGNPARNLPARPIIVQPDAQTIGGMLMDLRRCITRIGMNLKI